MHNEHPVDTQIRSFDGSSFRISRRTAGTETGCGAGVSDGVAAGNRITGRDGAGYCRRRDWLARDGQAIEMVDVQCGLNEVNVTVSRSTLRRIPSRQR